MCSIFEISATSETICEYFDLGAIPILPDKQVIRPTDVALVIEMDNTVNLLEWGIRVNWSHQPLINARAETLEFKPTFKERLENRCLIPASAYYEWRRDPSGKKYKNRITIDEKPFAIAGLSDERGFTIITCEACDSITHIHSRMPVILSIEDGKSWVNSSCEYRNIMEKLLPYPKVLSSHEQETRQLGFNWDDITV